MNGENNSSSVAGCSTGSCINCFSASRCTTQNDESRWRNLVHGFLCAYNKNCEYAEQSQQINCYFNQDGLPTPTSGLLGGEWQGTGVSLDYMKSQAFVDTLNMVAQLMGTNMWQYNAGGLPTPTSTIATQNSEVFFAGGDGSKTNPFLISNKDQLINVSWLVEHGYELRQVPQTDSRHRPQSAFRTMGIRDAYAMETDRHSRMAKQPFQPYV